MIQQVRRLVNHPEMWLTVVGVLALAVLYLIGLGLIALLPDVMRRDALSSLSLTFGALAAAISGSHVGLAAAGGGGALGVVKSLFTNQQPYQPPAVGPATKIPDL